VRTVVHDERMENVLFSFLNASSALLAPENPPGLLVGREPKQKKKKKKKKKVGLVELRRGAGVAKPPGATKAIPSSERPDLMVRFCLAMRMAFANCVSGSGVGVGRTHILR